MVVRTKKQQAEWNRSRLTFLLHGRDSGYCHYCRRPIYRAKTYAKALEADTATVEHLYPKTDLRRQLLNEEQNTVAACHRCNSDRNMREAERFRGLMGDWWTPHLVNILRCQQAADLAELLGDEVIENEINQL